MIDNISNEGRDMKQQGSSLIEVMVAIAILASGLLGLAALQARSVVWSQSVQQKSVMADIASDLADRIKANRSPFLARTELVGVTPANFPLPPDFANCPQNATPENNPVCVAQGGGRNAYRVQREMNEWYANMRALTNNTGRYTLVSANAGNGFFRYTLTLTWQDDHTQVGAAGDASFVAVIE